MTEEITCRYCNAQFPAAQAERSARGLTCPRCGEPLPAEHQQETATTATGPTAAPPEPARPTNRAVALIVLAVMAGIGLIGLGFALYTTPFRRGNDRKIVRAEPVPIEAPSEWAALGYLPATCNLLAGLQLAEALADPVGKQLLAEPRPPFLETGLTQLEKWTGFKADELSQVVAGVTIGAKTPEVVHLVAVTREPFKIEDRFKPLKLEKLPELHGKPYFGFRQPPAEGRLWCPDRYTVVLALRLDAFKKSDSGDLPFPPRQGSKGLAKEIQEALAGRLEKQSVAWICGHADWTQLPIALLLPNAKDWAIFTKVKTFGLSLTLEKDIVLNGQLFTGDAAVTQSLQKYLLGQGKGTSLRVEAPPADAGEESQWLTLQRKMSVEEARRLLGERAQ